MLKILMAASEAVPFAKTGGLADVMGSLPMALIQEGADVRVILPKYGTISPHLKDKILHLDTRYVKIGWKNQYCGIQTAEHNGVTYYFIDNERYYKRETLYGYKDEAERYAFFCRAVLEMLPVIDFVPDILHCHDWQAGLIPVLLEAQYRHLAFYREISTVFTIHNLRYQGVLGVELMKELTGLTQDYFTSDKLEFYGGAGFLKGGLVYSHKLTTVSAAYAEEIQTPFYGERLDGLLRARRGSLIGIINGIDGEEYNPFADPFLFTEYTRDTLSDKANNKIGLQRELNLPVRPEVPVIALISRLVDQKGLDLIAQVLDELLAEDLQFWVLGTGDARYEELFHQAAGRYPGKVSANIRFDNVLAHRIYAGADFFLMPSLFEPCGLGQLISLRYGTLPIVRETGGLKDSVTAYKGETGTGNGFTFADYNAQDMLYTIRRALQYYGQDNHWLALRQNAMDCDFSWHQSAKRYMELYQALKG